MGKNFFDVLGEDVISPLAEGIGIKSPNASAEEVQRRRDEAAGAIGDIYERRRDDRFVNENPSGNGAFIPNIRARTQERQGMADAAGAQYGQATQLQGEARQDQVGLADVLRQQMYGAGPSAAQAQLRQGQDAAFRQAASLAAMQRGNPALAQRQAAQSQENLALQTNQQAALLRAREQLAAQQQLGNVIQQMRAGDYAQQGLANQRQQGAQAARDALDAQDASLLLNSFGLGTNLAGMQTQASQQQAAQNQAALGVLLAAL